MEKGSDFISKYYSMISFREADIFETLERNTAEPIACEIEIMFPTTDNGNSWAKTKDDRYYAIIGWMTRAKHPQHGVEELEILMDNIFTRLTENDTQSEAYSLDKEIFNDFAKRIRGKVLKEINNHKNISNISVDLEGHTYVTIRFAYKP